MAQIDELIATYLSAVETEGKATRTIESYRDSLADFRRVGRKLGFPETIADFDVSHVYAFLADVRARPGRKGRGTTSAAYQNHHHGTVKAFFSWCRRMGYLDPDRNHVFARVPLARVETKVSRPFSEAEFERLLAGCDRSRLTGCRNHALLLFLLDNGMRAQECATVRLDEVDWERRRVLVHGKGAKQRWVGISERTAAALRDYVERFRGERQGALFRTSRGEALTDGHSLYVILHRLALRVGLERANPHRFRYSFATWAIASGARELDVQLLLGHSSPQMTQHYARAYDSTQAVEAHATLSPVGQLASTKAGAGNGRVPGKPAPDLHSSANRASHDLRSTATSAAVEPPRREEERVTTTKSAIEAGLTLVAKYKGEQHTCEVVEQDGRLYFVLADGRLSRSPSAAGKAVTGTATNGYRFWSIPEKAPSGKRGRQKAAREAVAAMAAEVEPSQADGVPRANGATRPPRLIQRAQSQEDVADGLVRYFCSSCMEAFEAEDAGRGDVPERCPQGHPAADAA
jgi:site-specific recombinase XerD